jgi:hypothetical protein
MLCLHDLEPLLPCTRPLLRQSVVEEGFDSGCFTFVAVRVIWDEAYETT